MGPTHGPTYRNSSLPDESTISGLLEILSLRMLSYINLGGVSGFPRSRVNMIDNHLEKMWPGDVLIALIRSGPLSGQRSKSLDTIYPIQAAQMHIARRISEIGLPEHIIGKPDIIFSTGLPDNVVRILGELMGVFDDKHSPPPPTILT